MRYYDETGLTAPQLDQTIVDLRKRGYTYRAIAKHLGMSVGGVYEAARRIEDGRPGRPPRA